jgi:hypothetical protein
MHRNKSAKFDAVIALGGALVRYGAVCLMIASRPKLSLSVQSGSHAEVNDGKSSNPDILFLACRPAAYC